MQTLQRGRCMKRLIVNADDFGLTTGVNRGIIECHRTGTVTSTTLMVNARASRDAAALAAGNPSLGVGLHLNLTSGKPVSLPGAVPSLVDDDGCFPGYKRAVIRLTTGAARRRELEAEVAAQIKKCTSLGVAPTHMDSHRHLHAHPRLAAVLADVCPPLGITKIRGYRMAPRSPRALTVAAVARLGGQIAGMSSPDRFFGVEVMGKKNMAAALGRELAAAGDIMEFMCHPGFADEELSLVSGYNSLREAELNALLSKEMADVIRTAGVKLVSYRDL